MMPEPNEPAAAPESDPQNTVKTPSSYRENTVFSTGQDTVKSFPTTAFVIAAFAIAILIATLILVNQTRSNTPNPNTLQPIAAYASSLSLSNIQMSESTSLSGGKSTYIDGTITNNGPSKVNGIIVQVLFANDAAMPPQLKTSPLYLIRTREPYIDTEPVSAAPIAPGAQVDFRLIFENVNENWNEQPPAIHIIQVKTR